MSFGRAVSILVPTFNEENYIRNAISSLIPTDGAFDYELIVLDGGSTDRTLGIIREMSVANRRIRLASNRARFQAAAMNIGARIAKRDSGIIIRADCHAEYPPDFVDRIARELRVLRVLTDVWECLAALGSRQSVPASHSLDESSSSPVFRRIFEHNRVEARRSRDYARTAGNLLHQPQEHVDDAIFSEIYC